MDLRQLRYFVTVAEELHFGRAAERLAMTQPPLSQQIRALEDELGVRLFHRTQRSVALTPVGARWLVEVRRVLAEAGALPALAQRLARGEVGSLSLSFVSTADYGILPAVLRHFREARPDVQLQLREATSDVQIEALLAGEVDAGIVIAHHAGSVPGELEYRPLVREPLVLAVPASRAARWGVEPGQPFPLADAAAEPLIIFPRRSAPALYDIITGYHAAHGGRPEDAGAATRIGQEAIQMQTIVSLVSAEMGVALVPASLCNLQRTGVVYLELAAPSPVIETGLVWRRDAASPVLPWFVASAEAVAKLQEEDNQT
ncbi:LysR substrate-binding domain-containing protein [Ralstonia mannitolilytica]|uniref:HTH-type transcriptional regulator BenM n=1 Tax=Ralstonia mannitolilytica TaxID=105219 RepID=A0AAD2EEX8_9RALS|nr:LysR substrate-binding domain-containing protein [Ralstonia mannitolilytica]MBY4718477.1 LysR family transcriptional regulator [Ralstonia mannitolilytica]CAJ0681109.1 HTH-type transcriptional regulator BenM [Ralstonia mannitolilytica]CAJ0694444.1 HTH-type transcriptional regulator BenM [Ralstonia mannitolilytica]CAJ0778087.1 HTH-type transcriptional regulator BenM [Ralstonia mannitolilytica]CAJ0850835.1 HTH-type transcriptional regulator BenM [Ralstonia mannitolilytica]